MFRSDAAAADWLNLIKDAFLTFFFMIVMLFSVCPSRVWIIIAKFAVTTNQ